MKIADLLSRFELYAINHKLIKHDPLNKKEKAFSYFSMATLPAANRNGLKFPCFFLKTPEVEKAGDADSVFENFDCSYFVVVPVANGDDVAMAKAFDDCKTICDDFFNRVLHDAREELFDGLQVNTSEGEVGPIIDNCYGWGVVFTIQQGFDAELSRDKWEDLD